jgi:tRNA pseudouridine55 synthase
LRRIDTVVWCERCVTLAQLEAMPEPERLASLLRPNRCWRNTRVSRWMATIPLDSFEGCGARHWPTAEPWRCSARRLRRCWALAHVKDGELVPDRLC